MEIVIRKTRARDFRAIFEILRLQSLLKDWFTEARFRETIRKQNGIYLVAEEKGRVVGMVFCDFYELGTKGYIYKFAVHTDYVRKGIGGTLIERVVFIARGFGLLKLHARVKESNTDSQATFRSRGFLKRQGEKLDLLVCTILK